MTAVRLIFLLGVFLSTFVPTVVASTALSESESIGLASAFEYQFSEASFDEIRAVTSDWLANTDGRFNVGFTADAVWLKAQVHNPTQNTQWYLTLGNTRLDFVEFYLVTEQGLQKGTAGDKLAYSTSPSALPTFRFLLETNASGILFLRVKSDSKVAFYPTVRSSYQYGEFQAYMEHMHYFYIALFIFFTLSQFALNRAPVSAMNFYYGAGLLFAFLHLFMYYGEGNYILWQHSVYLKNRMHFVFANLSFLFFTLFLQCYLRTKVTTPNLHKLFLAFSSMCGVCAIATALPIPNAVMVHIILAESAIISGLAVLGTFRCLQVGNRWAMGLAIPLVFSVIALVVYAFTFLGLLPYTKITSNLILLSLPLDIVMISGSFVYRHLQLQKENRRLLESLRKNELQSANVVSQSASRLSNINEEKVLKDLVDFLDTQKTYLEGGITLDDVASAIDVRSDQLSAVINSRLNTSFSTLLNLKRLDAAAKLLVSEKDTSILDVALRCGFGSKSSFNRLFKEQFDATPSQYRKIIRFNSDG